ncbi:archaeosortase/exosortase family protein [Nisaea sp.]|uniref:archaeosortase/exosortase family protein n=1 Tax=Nisaea sp. TaxID=2024842 RepID=UPI002B271D69|nr:archaeosortase/exosortase family protein [Nisaea sp.]
MRAAVGKAGGYAAPCWRALDRPLLCRDVVWIALALISAGWLWRGLYAGTSWPVTVSVLCAVAVAVDLQRSRPRVSGRIAGPLALLLFISPAPAGGISIIVAILIAAFAIGVAAKSAKDTNLCAAAFMLAVTALSEFFSGVGADVVSQTLLESEARMLGKLLAVAGETHQLSGSVLFLSGRQVVLLTECSSFILIAEAAVLTLALGRLLRVNSVKLVVTLAIVTVFTALLNLGRLTAMLFSPQFYGQLHNEAANQVMGFAICAVVLVLLFPKRGTGA